MEIKLQYSEEGIAPSYLLMNDFLNEFVPISAFVRNCLDGLVPDIQQVHIPRSFSQRYAEMGYLIKTPTVDELQAIEELDTVISEIRQLMTSAVCNLQELSEKLSKLGEICDSI